MRDHNHITQFRRGYEDWRAWRLSNPKVEPNLSGADLSTKDLAGIDLSKARLIGANLSNANLIRANLGQADLRDADLSGTTLIGANLRGANLSAANLSGANLNGADASEAHLYETTFGGTNLTRAVGLDTCKHYGPSIIDLRTLIQSPELPLKFLRGCGLPDAFIEFMPSLIDRPNHFYSCFISYSHADGAFAQRLYDYLQGKGIRCWLDKHQMNPGDDIYEKVDHGIQFWDKVLLCCSVSSLTSWWVDNEIDIAFEKERQLMRERQRKVFALIPLNLDNYMFTEKWHSGKGRQIRSRVAADFTGWNGGEDRFASAADSLIDALRAGQDALESTPKSRL